MEIKFMFAERSNTRSVNKRILGHAHQIYAGTILILNGLIFTAVFDGMR